MKHLGRRRGFSFGLTSIFRLWRVLFPSYCVHCHVVIEDNEPLCPSCRLKLVGPAHLHQRSQLMTRMFDGALPLEESIGLFYFKERGVIQSLLHALKYKGRRDIGEWMGELIAYRMHDRNLRPDKIIPVPSHPKKVRKRGYNQAELIANSISRRTGIPVDTRSLRRFRHSDSNTKLGRWARWENVGDAFKWESSQQGGHYLLVDDVLTTGSTIQACIEKALESDSSARWSIATAALVWRD